MPGSERRRPRRQAALAAAAGALALLLGAALSPAAAKTAREAAYETLLADPADFGKNVAYARILIAEEDFEAAAAVLERLSLLYPGQPQIELELAACYYRLGSYLRAAAGFERVLADLAASPA